MCVAGTFVTRHKRRQIVSLGADASCNCPIFRDGDICRDIFAVIDHLLSSASEDDDCLRAAVVKPAALHFANVFRNTRWFLTRGGRIADSPAAVGIPTVVETVLAGRGILQPSSFESSQIRVCEFRSGPAIASGRGLSNPGSWCYLNSILQVSGSRFAKPNL